VPMVRKVLKRMLDIAVSSVALVLLSPVLLALAIAVRVDSQGPIFYKSDRMGKKARVFRCLKFRTMVPDAERRKADVLHMNERDSVLFKITNDPRITRVGRFLRKYSLDELPQLFNVLRGEMSLVGPRPHAAGTRAGGILFEQAVPCYAARHQVRPGLTGLAQGRGSRGATETREKLVWRVASDLEYIDSWSPWLDCLILMRTAAGVLRMTNAF
jgi:polysaccharide biosynthesis protein PslA